MPTVSIYLTPELSEKLEEIAEEANEPKSLIVRKALEEYIRKYEYSGKGGEERVTAMIVAVLRYIKNMCTCSTLHNTNVKVLFTTHTHINGDCVELYLVEGSVKDIAKFAHKIRALPTAKKVEYVII